MKKKIWITALSCFSLLFLAGRPSVAQGKFTMYFIDVDGGEAVLAISPSGNSLLMDVGDAPTEDHVIAAAKLAHLKHIDAVVVSHYHADHIGGAFALTESLPVRKFYDHGPNVEADDGAPVGGFPKQYADAFGKSQHQEVKPGDKIPLGGMDVTVVAAGDKAITQPLSGKGDPNPYCKGLIPNEEPSGKEDPQSVGILVQFGNFKFLNLADGGGGRIGRGNRPFDLLCPNNLIGNIDVMMTPTHDLLPPLAAFAGASPRIAVADNNAGKHDSGSETLEGYKAIPGFEDLWLNYPLRGDETTSPPSNFIANVDKQTGNYLKLTAEKDGSFTVYNSRNNFVKHYPARRNK
jgi:L-ascorbate metabolism protein UlaG (beta-lactamase superfamily)